MKFLQRASLPALCLCIASSVLISSTAYSNPTEIHSLPELLVSATRSTSTPSWLPAAQIVIDREQIELSGASTVAEILASTAGIQLRDLFGNGTSVTVGMRGFGDNASLNSLIMIDGRRLNNSLDIGSARLSSLSVEQIEAIEIISGSAGVLFGDSAVGGVINIITRSSGKHAIIQVSRGSDDNEQYRVSVGDQNVEWDLAVSAEKRLADNYRDHNNSDTESVNFEVGCSFTNGRVWLELSRSSELQLLPGALFSTEYAANRKASRNTSDFLDGQYRSYRGGLNVALSQHWHLELDITNRIDDIDGSQVAFGSASATRQERTQSSVNPRLIGRFSQSNGDMIITTGFDYDDADYFLSSVFGVQQAQQQIQSLYAQLLFPISNAVTLQVGARYSQLDSDFMDSFIFPTGSSDDDNFTRHSFGLEWSATQNLQLFLRRDENFRFLKIEEQTNQFNFTGIYQPLNNQQGVSLETGFIWGVDQTALNFSLYELKLNNEIVYDGTNFTNINLDNTKRVGADLIVTSDLNSALSLKFQLSLVDAKFDAGPYRNKSIPFVAEQNFSAGLNYRTKAAGSFHLEWLKIAERFAASDFSNGFAKIGAQDQLNFAWRIKKDQVSVEARINNLRDEKLISFATVAYNPATFTNDVGFYAAPERNFLITVTYQPDL